MTLFKKCALASLFSVTLVVAGCSLPSHEDMDEHASHQGKASHQSHQGHHAAQHGHMDKSVFNDANQTMMMDMHAIALTGDVDYDFVVGMIPHHQGAIDMAEQLLASAQLSDALRPLAQDIIAAQSTEIAFMNSWLANYGDPRPSANAEQIIAAYDAVNAQMMSDMNHLASSGDVNRDFVEGMIPHHEAAVSMAEVLLQFSSDPVLRKMAEAVISEQTREISLMQAY